MHMARPALLISLFLATLTLIYSGRWAGTDPRAGEVETAQLANTSETAQ